MGYRWLAIGSHDKKIGMEEYQGTGLRVAREIKTTFARSYAQGISSKETLRPDAVR